MQAVAEQGKPPSHQQLDNNLCRHNILCTRFGSFSCVHRVVVPTLWGDLAVAVRMPLTDTLPRMDPTMESAYRQSFKEQLTVQQALKGQAFAHDLLAVRTPELLTVEVWGEGETLLQRLVRASNGGEGGEPWSAVERMSIVLQLLQLLQVLRNKRIIHTDIKV